MELTNFIYDFNLATTKTISDGYERCLVINSGRKTNIEYQNCINLYDLIKIFNSSYIEYLEHKNTLLKLLRNLGKEVIYRTHTVTDNFSYLCVEALGIKPEVWKKDEAIIHLVNNNGNYYAWAEEYSGKKLENRKNVGVQIDKDIIKDCLKIIEKHNLFIECFYNMCMNSIYSDGATTIYSEISRNIFSKFSRIKLSFGNLFLNTTDYIEVVFKLGNELEIFYEKSKVIFDDKNITNLEEKTTIINELLSSIYVHNDYLSNLYKNKEVNKTYIKKGENL